MFLILAVPVGDQKLVIEVVMEEAMFVLPVVQETVVSSWDECQTLKARWLISKLGMLAFVFTIMK